VRSDRDSERRMQPAAREHQGGREGAGARQRQAVAPEPGVFHPPRRKWKLRGMYRNCVEPSNLNRAIELGLQLERHICFFSHFLIISR